MGSGFVNVKTKMLSNVHAGDIVKDKIIRKNRFRLSRLPYFLFAFSRMIMTLQWIFRIMIVNWKNPITLIHAQDTGYSGLAAIISGKIMHIPTVISSHGIRHKTLESNIQGLLKNISLRNEHGLDCFTIKNASGTIAVSPSIKKYFEKISKKIEFIPIPIKLADFEFSDISRDLIRREMGIDRATPVIGFVGRFSPEKNLLGLLRSFTGVSQIHPTTKIMLVGTGPLEHQLKLFVHENGMQDNVIFCGVRYDIDKILSALDIFVLPSYTEGLSISILEAMACGRAIICSNIPANQDLLDHNISALLVNPNDHKEISSAIISLLDDNSFRTKLGNNAKMKAKEYDEDKIYSKIVRYYEKLLAE